MALVLLVASILVAIWAATAALASWNAYGDLTEARTAFVAAERLLRDGDLSGAQAATVDGVDRAASASARLHHPQMWPLRYLPVVGSNLRTTATLSDAVRDTGRAGARFLEAAQVIVHDDRQSVLGEVSIAYLEELGPPLQALAETLARTTEEVQAAGGGLLIGRVEDARQEYLDLALPAVDQAQLAAAAAEVMPAFLGAEQPRTYLLGAASLSELRGSGGLLGSWSLLSTDRGHLDISEFRDIDQLGDLARDVPAPYEGFPARYVDRGGLRAWRNVNMTPDFPTSAQVILEMWEELGQRPLDGVIVVDPIVYQRLVERTGPIEVPGVTTLAPQDVLEFVALEAYAAFDDDDERKAVLGAVATAAFVEMLNVLEDDDVPATVEMLLDLAEGGHLRVYATDPSVQPVLERIGVAGQLPRIDGEFAGVYVTNAAANKVDAFTERWVEHRVALQPEGATRTTISAGFHNHAPRDGYPRHVIGPWTDRTDAGDNLSIVSFACGSSCEIQTSHDEALLDTELGVPMAELGVLVPAGERRNVRATTATSDAWVIEDGELVLPVHHHLQPTLFDTALRVSVSIPDGWRPSTFPDGAAVDGDAVVWETAGSGMVSARFGFVPDGTDRP